MAHTPGDLQLASLRPHGGPGGGGLCLQSEVQPANSSLYKLRNIQKHRILPQYALKGNLFDANIPCSRVSWWPDWLRSEQRRISSRVPSFLDVLSGVFLNRRAGTDQIRASARGGGQHLGARAPEADGRAGVERAVEAPPHRASLSHRPTLIHGRPQLVLVGGIGVVGGW